MDRINKFNLLNNKISKLANYPYHSRVHLLKTLGSKTHPCYIKRDDELGFGITGSKLRKYLSLLTYLLEQQTEQALLIGGAYSNHITSLVQLLIENDIEPILFLLGNPDYALKGNLLLTSLMVPKDNIHWISRADWSLIDKTVEDYTKCHESKHLTIIPEGAFMAEALPGALTLAIDILKNEQELNIHFDHIFIDAGTGLSAMAIILAFAWLKNTVCVHVLLLADTAEFFLQKLNQVKNDFKKLLDISENDDFIINNFQLHFPTQGQSFGSTNQATFQHIAHIMRHEGIFTDPIYSAKLFYETNLLLKDNDLKGNTLLIHSGGGLTLLGFQDQLARTLL